MLTGKRTVFLVVLLLVSLSCGMVLAAAPAKNVPAKADSIKVDPVEQDANLANSIAKLFGFSVDTQKITSLREKQYSYAEIALVFSLADFGKKPSSDVIALRDSKMLWKDVAKQLGVKTEKAMLGVSRIMQDMNMETETDKLRNKINNETNRK